MKFSLALIGGVAGLAAASPLYGTQHEGSLQPRRISDGDPHEQIPAAGQLKAFPQFRDKPKEKGDMDKIADFFKAIPNEAGKAAGGTKKFILDTYQSIENAAQSTWNNVKDKLETKEESPRLPHPESSEFLQQIAQRWQKKMQQRYEKYVAEQDQSRVSMSEDKFEEYFNEQIDVVSDEIADEAKRDHPDFNFPKEDVRALLLAELDRAYEQEAS